ncbi:MAG: hypothetical protein KDC53_23630 [Saprospiraceae bacterium]|nr:hypothetical protein [Saprospiraceae bacterium]
MKNLQEMQATLDRELDISRILSDQAKASLIQMKKGKSLKEHQSVSQALLILVKGKALYEEHERSLSLSIPFDFVDIPAKVTHRLTAQEDCSLLLIQ